MTKFFIPKIFSKHGLNYSGQDLRGKSFAWRNLSGANFSGADIRGVNFKGANLENADFRNAVFGGDGSNPSAIKHFITCIVLPPILIMVIFIVVLNLFENFNYIIMVPVIIFLMGSMISCSINIENRFVKINKSDLYGYPTDFFPVNKTIFWKANLKGANFSNTTLNDTFFTDANIENTNFKNVKKIGLSHEYPENFAIKLILLRGTILDDEKVRQLLISGKDEFLEFAQGKNKVIIIEKDKDPFKDIFLQFVIAFIVSSIIAFITYFWD